MPMRPKVSLNCFGTPEDPSNPTVAAFRVHRRELPTLLFVLSTLFFVLGIPAAVLAGLSVHNRPEGIQMITFGTISITTFCIIFAVAFFVLAVVLLIVGLYFKLATTVRDKLKFDGGFDDDWEETEMAVNMMGVNTVKKKKRMAEKFASDMMHRTAILILENGALQEAFIKYDPEGLQVIYRIKKAPKGVASKTQDSLLAFFNIPPHRCFSFIACLHLQLSWQLSKSCEWVKIPRTSRVRATSSPV